MGASYSFNFERIIEETRHIVRILTLPVARDGVKISGALGNAEAEKVIRVHAGRAIVLEDPGKILFGKAYGIKLRHADVHLRWRGEQNCVW